MSVMDIGHVSMLVLGARMFVHVRVGFIRSIMSVELIMSMTVLMDDGLMNMEMGVLLPRQEQSACHHEYGSHNK